MVDKIEAYSHVFINNVYGSYIAGLAEFIKTELFPRAQDIIIGTYEKSVQRRLDRLKDQSDAKHRTPMPYLTINPGLDIEPEEMLGKFLYNYPAFENRHAAREFVPCIYDDGSVKITTAMNYYTGEIELIIWCSSVYELLDYRIMIYQFFGGLNRPIYPKNIECYYILPDELITHSYTNEYTGVKHNLDWNNTNAGVALIKNINRDRYVCPFGLNPFLKLVSVSDASEKYGSDALSEYKLSVTMSWESMLPTHLLVSTKTSPELLDRIVFSVDVDSRYVKENNITVSNQKSMISIDSVTGQSKNIDVIYIEAFNYQLYEEDIIKFTNKDPFSITIPHNFTDKQYYIDVYSKYGQMYEGYHWRFEKPVINFLTNMISGLEVGNYITIVLYEEE